jgi:hypothetical protein
MIDTDIPVDFRRQGNYIADSTKKGKRHADGPSTVFLQG